jgi:FkbM family methyltransferase
MLNNTLGELSLKELRSICKEFSIPSYGAKKTISKRIQKMLLYETFTFSKFNREIKIKDYRFDYIFEKIKMEKDFYEHELLDEIKSVLSENNIIIDVGGHIGNHSIYFLKVCDFDKSYIFEPRKPLISLIRENAILNDIAEKVIINLNGVEAISSQQGMLKFEKRKDYNLGTGKITNAPGSSKVATLDSVFGDTADKISLIKIDVEGLEREVLKGAKKVIDKHTPVISIESLVKSESQLEHDAARDSLNELIGDSYKIHYSFGALPGPYTYIFVPIVVN